MLGAHGRGLRAGHSVVCVDVCVCEGGVCGWAGEQARLALMERG